MPLIPIIPIPPLIPIMAIPIPIPYYTNSNSAINTDDGDSDSLLYQFHH